MFTLTPELEATASRVIEAIDNSLVINNKSMPPITRIAVQSVVQLFLLMLHGKFVHTAVAVDQHADSTAADNATGASIAETERLQRESDEALKREQASPIPGMMTP